MSTPVAWSDALRVLARRFGGLPAVGDGGAGERLTYAGLCARAHALAERLDAAAIAPGTAVATLLPNGPDAVWAAYGVRLTGAAETPLSWTYTDDEIAWSASLAGFRCVVTEAGRCEALRALGLVPIDVASIPPVDPGTTRAPVPGEARGRILFTSGTTGRPKGVVYTHARRWTGEQLQKAALPFTPAPGSRILLMTPFVHGASLLAFAWLDHGGELVLLDGVDPPRVLPLLRAGRLDAVFAPPTVLAKLAAAAGDPTGEAIGNATGEAAAGTAGDPIAAGVRCVFTGTQPLSAALYRKARALFGPVVRITYGKSECVNPITVLPPAEVDARLGGDDRSPDASTDASPDASTDALPDAPGGACVGWPAPGVEIRITAPDDPSAPVAPPTEGEVWLRARHMSNAMLTLDGEHPHAPDGWHRTGDLGFIDAQGCLRLTGRVADVIKTGGYRVNPDEIEALLAAIDGCGPVCVTSVPSEYWGEVIVGVAEQAGGPWREAAQARVATLSRHKRPRLWIAVPSLPRNPQGKISRRAVARLLLETHDWIDGPYPSLVARGEAPRAGDADARRAGIARAGD